MAKVVRLLERCTGVFFGCLQMHELHEGVDAMPEGWTRRSVEGLPTSQGDGFPVNAPFCPECTRRVGRWVRQHGEQEIPFRELKGVMIGLPEALESIAGDLDAEAAGARAIEMNERADALEDAAKMIRAELVMREGSPASLERSKSDEHGMPCTGQ